MKKSLMILVCLIGMFLFASFGVVSAQAYYNDYSDVLLVCNAESSISQEICSYFIEKRVPLDFNVTKIVNLTSISTSETVTDEVYNNILTQINSTIQSIGPSTINYIVTTKGVPLRTSDRSIDSKLMYSLGARTTYSGRENIFSYSEYGGYLITRLTGYDVNDAKRLIDNADNADLNGTILLNPHSSKYNTYYCDGAASDLSSRGISYTLNKNTFVKNAHNLSGYWSWGSNACGNADSCANSSDWNLSFVPGAIGETAVSTSARTFNIFPWDGSGPYGGQSLILDLIRYNITGVKGYVYEPYLSAVANSEILFNRYTQGYTLADSFYMASFNRNWMDVVIGDPKAHVVENAVSPAISIETLYPGQRIDNDTIINVSIASSPFFNIDSVWYSMNGANHSLTSPYDIDTSSWVYGEYNLTVYANDSGGNEGSKVYSFIVNSTVGDRPNYLTFSGNDTTNFKILENWSGVDGAILDIDLAGKISFLQDNLNFSGADLDSDVSISHNYVYINSTAIPTLNVSANVTFYETPSTNFPRSSYLTILRDGAYICNETTSPACYNFTPLDSEVVVFNVSEWGSYSIGYSDAIGISTCSELQNMKNDLDADYILLNDIDCSETRYWNWNSSGGGYYMGWEPVGQNGTKVVDTYVYSFNGSLDGQGYGISGLYINRSHQDYVGLFGIMEGYSLGEMINISGAEVYGRNYTGFFSGMTVDGSGLDLMYVFSNLSIGGSLVGEDYVGGGVTGHLEGHALEQVRVVANITGQNYVGGIIGDDASERTEASRTYYAYSNSNITGQNYVGGIVGKLGCGIWCGSYVYYAYSNSNITGQNYVGGLLGYMDTVGVGSSSLYFSFTSSNVSGLDNFSSVVGYRVAGGFGQNRIGNVYWDSSIEGNVNYGNVYGDSYTLLYKDSPSCTSAGGSWDGGSFKCHGGVPIETNYSTIVVNHTSYFYNVSNSPMSEWDFDSVWSKEYDGDDFPVLQFEGVSILPLIDILLPVNGSTFVSGTTNLSVAFNVSDSAGIANCTAYVTDTNGTVESSQSNSSVLNVTSGTNNTINVLGLSAGNWEFFVNCSDIYGNENKSEIRSFTISSPSSDSTTDSTTSGGSSSQVSLGSEGDIFGSTTKVRYGYQYNFDFGGSGHRFLLREIDRAEGTARIDVYSDKKEVVLKEGESENVDLDEDGEFDIVMTLEKIYSDSVAVDLLISDYVVSGLDDSEGEDSGDVSEGDTGEGLEEENEILNWIISVLILVAVAVAVVVWRRRKGA